MESQSGKKKSYHVLSLKSGFDIMKFTDIEDCEISRQHHDQGFLVVFLEWVIGAVFVGDKVTWNSFKELVEGAIHTNEIPGLCNEHDMTIRIKIAF